MYWRHCSRTHFARIVTPGQPAESQLQEDILYIAPILAGICTRRTRFPKLRPTSRSSVRAEVVRNDLHLSVSVDPSWTIKRSPRDATEEPMR